MSESAPTATVTLELQPDQEMGIIDVTVKSTTGSLLEGATVYVESYNDGGDTVDTTKDTKSDGRARFEVPILDYQVSSNPNGYGAESVIVEESDFQ